MSLLDPVERTRRGAQQQSQLLAAAAREPRTLLEASWRDYIFAEIWTRPGLYRRARYLISISGAACSNGPAEILEGYIRGALTQKELTLPELREGALHLAVYAGWSNGAALDAAITRVADAMGLPQAPFPPIRGEAWDPAVRHKEGAAGFLNVMKSPGPAPNTPYFDGGIINFVFGEMWERPGLDQRSRRWITLVAVADSSSPTPIRSHTHAAMASGNATREEMDEFVLQYGIHGGWPKASVMQAAVMEMADRVAKGQPYY